MESSVEVTNEKSVKKNRYRAWLYMCLFLLLFFFSVFGITYSIFNNTGGDNPVDTGKIIFTYSDVNQRGNGIYIEDAVPTEDEHGKLAVGKDSYFDFQVTMKAGKVNFVYYIVAEKEENSTLKNSDMKLYLTKLTAGTETAVSSEILTYDQLENYQSSTTEKILFEKESKKIPIDATENYRLRMWIKDGVVDYEGKQFSVKINVYATTKE